MEPSLRYDWPIAEIPSTCLRGEPFTIDHTMICMRGGFVILQHLEGELLNMVCKDVATEPLLQDVEGEQLTWGSNKAQDARLDIHVNGFWKPSDQPLLMSGFLTRMLNPIETSSCSVYMIMRKSVNNQVECSILNMENWPLWFLQQLVEMGMECLNYHSRLAQLIAIKKGEDYAKTITSFALLISTLLRLTATRTTVRKSWNFCYTDI